MPFWLVWVIVWSMPPCPLAALTGPLEPAPQVRHPPLPAGTGTALAVGGGTMTGPAAWATSEGSRPATAAASGVRRTRRGRRAGVADMAESFRGGGAGGIRRSDLLI